MQQGGSISKEARMTPFTLIVTFPVGAANGNTNGNLFVDENELPETKLGNGKATYIDFYASLDKKTVKVWSEVQESEFALTKGWAIEKVTVLGLAGKNAAGLELNIHGNSVLHLLKVELTSTGHNYLFQEDEDVTKKSLMVEVKGLNIPIGKNFAMSWKMSV